MDVNIINNCIKILNQLKTSKMKKLNQFYFTLALILSVGLASCSSDNDKISDVQAAADTYVSLAIQMPKTNIATRAGETASDEWVGRDDIKAITVYMVNEDNNTVTTTNDIKTTSIEDGKLLPSVVIAKATAGTNLKAYVVVNDVNKVLTKHIKTTSADAFKASYGKAVEALVSQLAKTETTDIILMTNAVEPTAQKVERGVTEKQITATENVKNRFNVEVSRVASRAIVTVVTADDENRVIKVTDNNGVKTASIKVTGITYSVGQVNAAFNIIENGINPMPNVADKDLDNSKSSIYADVQAIESKEAVKVALGDEEDAAKYVLPLVRDSYLKGNTTYFEVRATFQVQGNLTDTKAPHEPGTTVFLGEHDGKFYADRLTALGMGVKLHVDSVKAGKFDQRVYTYKDAEMVYVLWLNPEKGTDGKTEKSPVVRNQVYHAHITGFNKIGVSYNPLNPTDPSKPVDPTDPNKPVDPTNPTDPTEPSNPINPDDKLTTDDNYLSVEVSILPWTIKSYDISVGQEY